MNRLISLTALAVALGCPGAEAQYTDGTIKIGVMNDMSGTYADLSGQGSVIAARMVGGLQVDYEFKLHWGLNWKVAWFLAVENLIHIRCGTTKLVVKIKTVGQQAASIGEEPAKVHSWNSVAVC
jgi:hypothetical protein